MSRERTLALLNPTITVQKLRDALSTLYDDLDVSYADLSKDLDETDDAVQRIEKALKESKSFAEFKKRVAGDAG